jgi:hypothetical protein
MTVTYSPHGMNQIETIPEPGTCWLHQRQRNLPPEPSASARTLTGARWSC